MKPGDKLLSENGVVWEVIVAPSGLLTYRLSNVWAAPNPPHLDALKAGEQ